MFKDKTILIIDKEIEVAEYMSRTLQLYFKRVFVANQGDESLDQFYRHRPDVVITDYNIPYINGGEIISIIKSEFPNQKIVLLSAYDKEYIEEDFEQYQADIYLNKPVSKDTLFSCLEEILI